MTVSINGVTVNNQTPIVGSTVNLGAVMSKHNCLFDVSDWSSTGTSGIAAAIAIELDGSYDGDTWFPIATENVTNNGIFVLSPSNNNTFLALYLRAVANVLNGTASAVITADIVSAV